jgi:hypothetical protein
MLNRSRLLSLPLPAWGYRQLTQEGIVSWLKSIVTWFKKYRQLTQGLSSADSRGIVSWLKKNGRKGPSLAEFSPPSTYITTSITTITTGVVVASPPLRTL